MNLHEPWMGNWALLLIISLQSFVFNWNYLKINVLYRVARPLTWAMFIIIVLTFFFFMRSKLLTNEKSALTKLILLSQHAVDHRSSPARWELSYTRVPSARCPHFPHLREVTPRFPRVASVKRLRNTCSTQGKCWQLSLTISRPFEEES